MSNASLEIVVGLPGSGKTTYLRNRLAHGAIEVFFDDYQMGAPEDDKSNPAASPNYAALEDSLEHQKRVAITDIRYCDGEEFTIVDNFFADRFPGMPIMYVYFANDPKACRHNVLLRNQASTQKLQTDLAAIERFGPLYHPPQNQMIPVIMG